MWAPHPTIPLPSPARSGWGLLWRRARMGRDGAACAGAVTLPETLKTQKRLFPFFFFCKREWKFRRQLKHPCKMPNLCCCRYT